MKGANTLQAEKNRRESEAFRRRDETPPEPVPDMRPIPDLRKPWPVHPERCACPPCVERFGAVEGEHVEGCNCASCFTARKEAAGGARRAPSGVVPLPRQHRTSKPRAPVREASAAVVEIHKPAEPPPARKRPYRSADGVYVHPPDCACEWCGEEDLEPAGYVQLSGGAS